MNSLHKIQIKSTVYWISRAKMLTPQGQRLWVWFLLYLEESEEIASNLVPTVRANDGISPAKSILTKLEWPAPVQTENKDEYGQY